MSALLPDTVLALFNERMAAAAEAGEHEPNAMCLSTVKGDGVSSRMVLLNAWDERGFVFYTNLESDKGQQLHTRPRAALNFHWKSVEQQVRVEGRVEAVSANDADAYFASRPRGSQLGAWASDQSRPLSDRQELLDRVAALEAQYSDGPVPRPPHWSGFRVLPSMIEFWLGGSSRLHDRDRYTFDGERWQRSRLFP